MCITAYLQTDGASCTLSGLVVLESLIHGMNVCTLKPAQIKLRQPGQIPKTS